MEEIVSFLITIFIRLIDPITIIIGLIGGALIRSWGMVLCFIAGLAIAIEMYLHLFEIGSRSFHPAVWLAGLCAAATWTLISFSLRKLMT